MMVELRKLLKIFYYKYLRPVRVQLAGNKRKVRRSRRYILTMHNIYAGKRCFILGNGPSLTSEDVDKLNHDIWFASNRIYQIFNKTECRPSYYCAEDHMVLKDIGKEKLKSILCVKFIGVGDVCKVPKMKDAIYLEIRDNDFYPNLPNFSEDISKGICQGNTVTYMAIQIAIYMGFKEIYLLGVDHNYSYNLNPNGSITYNEGVKDYFSPDGKISGAPQIQKMTLAYQAAKQYADAHGIKIYNATRGGKLEVFERVDYNTLFEEKKLK